MKKNVAVPPLVSARQASVNHLHVERLSPDGTVSPYEVGLE